MPLLGQPGSAQHAPGSPSEELPHASAFAGLEGLFTHEHASTFRFEHATPPPPEVPDVPELPEVPVDPDDPDVPEVPELPDVPSPELPADPELPAVDPLEPPLGTHGDAAVSASPDDPELPSLDGTSCGVTRPPRSLQNASHATHEQVTLSSHCRPEPFRLPSAQTQATSEEQTSAPLHEPPSPTARVPTVRDEVIGSVHVAPLVPELHAFALRAATASNTNAARATTRDSGRLTPLYCHVAAGAQLGILATVIGHALAHACRLHHPSIAHFSGNSHPARDLHGAPNMCRHLAFIVSSALLFSGVTSLIAGCSSTQGGATIATDPAPAPAPIHPGESEQSKQQEKDATTAVVIGVDAESFQSQGFAIDRVEVTAKVDGVVAASETLLASTGPLFPHELKLNPPSNKPDAPIEIEVVARAQGDASMPPIVTRRATTHFVKGKTKLAYVFLEIRCNTFPLLGGGGPSGPTCAAPTTCVAGTCVSAELPVLDDYQADWPTNPPSACGTGAPELTIGQGETALAPLADNETVTLEEGPQCGHHLWFSLRMKNLAQAGTITTLSATQPGSAITVPATAYPYAWGPSEGGACDLVGVRFQLDLGGAKASDFLGKPLDVKVDLKDKAGHTATSTRRVNVAAEMKVIPGRNCAAGTDGT